MRYIFSHITLYLRPIQGYPDKLKNYFHFNTDPISFDRMGGGIFFMGYISMDITVHSTVMEYIYIIEHSITVAYIIGLFNNITQCWMV
jgi:hypothetical protein